MARFPLDAEGADRLFGGQVDPADAPVGLGRVAELVQTAGGPAHASELRSEASVVLAVATAAREAQSFSHTTPRRTMRSTVSAKALSLIAAATLISATAAAAAGGVLPAGAQNAVSGAASTVGVDVPKSKNHGHHNGTKVKTGDKTPGNGNGVGPDATGPAAFGLCQAFASGPSTTNPNDGKSKSVAMRNLAKAAADKGQTVAAYCKAVDAAQATKTTDGSEAPEVTEAPETPDAPEAPETTDTKPANPGQSNAVHGNSTSPGHTPTTGGSGHPSGPPTTVH